MQYAPHELREKLLRGLDKDNNVVDMPLVLETISILEKYPVTKEVLEQTRIGRYVNELRKKTADKNLARRAKELVRRWQRFIESSSTATTSVNGERVGHRRSGGSGTEAGLLSAIPATVLDSHTGSRPNSPASRPGTPSSLKSVQSPSLPSVGTPNCSRPATPGYQQRASPNLMCSRPVTPGSKPASPAAASGRRLSPSVSTPLTSTPVSISQSHSQRLGSSTPATSIGSSHETLSKGNVADKRKRRMVGDGDTSAKKAFTNNNGIEQQHKVRLKPESGTVMNGLVHGSHQDLVAEQTRSDSLGNTPHNNTVSVASNEDYGTKSPEPSLAFRQQANLNIQTTGVCDSVDSGTPTSDGSRPRLERTPSSSSLSARTPKVRSTAQLIHDLYTRGDLRIKGSQTVSKIALNQIEKEPDIVPAVVPPEAKPRPRRKPGTGAMPPQTSDKTLSQTKTEMVEKFLQSSVSHVSDPVSLTPTSSEPDMNALLLESSVPVDSPVSLAASNLLMDTVGNVMQEDSTCMSTNGSVDTSVSQSQLALPDTVPNSGVDGMRQEETMGAQIDWSEVDDPFSLLPPLDVEGIDWSEPEVPIGHFGENVSMEEAVEVLHTKDIPAVNGNHDYNNEWRNWHETVSLPTYNGELLHVLPYVNIDD